MIRLPHHTSLRHAQRQSHRSYQALADERHLQRDKGFRRTSSIKAGLSGCLLLQSTSCLWIKLQAVNHALTKVLESAVLPKRRVDMVIQEPLHIWWLLLPNGTKGFDRMGLTKTQLGVPKIKKAQFAKLLTRVRFRVTRLLQGLEPLAQRRLHSLCLVAGHYRIIGTARSRSRAGCRHGNQPKK